MADMTNDITLDVGLDFKDAKSSAERFEKVFSGSMNKAQKNIVNEFKKVDEVTNRINESETKLKSVTSTIKNLNSILKNSESAYSESSNRIAAYTNSISTTDNEIARLKEQIKSLTKERKALPFDDDESFNKLSEKLSSARKELSKFKEARENLINQGTLNNIENDFKVVENYNSLKSALVSATEQQNKYRSELSETQAQLADQKALLADMLLALEPKKATIFTSLRDQLYDMGYLFDSEYEKLGGIVSAVNDENNALQQNESEKNKNTEATNKLTDANTKKTKAIKEETDATDKESKSASGLSSVFGKLGVALSATAKKLNIFKKNGASNFSKMRSEVNKTSKGLNKATGLIKKFILAGIGVRSIYFLFRKFWNMVKDGVKIMAQVDEDTNKALSSIATASYSLKKQLGSLSATIVQAVAPALTYIINLLVKAIEAATKFFAILSGKSSYKRATTEQQDFAASLDKSSKSAKKAKDENKKYLSGLDEIARWEDKNKDSGGGTDLSGAYEDVPIDGFNKFSDVLDKIKKKLKDIKDLFLKGFFDGLGDWKSRVADIKKNIGIIKDALKDIFTDPKVLASLDNYIRSVIYNLGRIVGATASIGLTIAQNLVGGLAKYLDEHRDYLKDRIAKIFDVKAEIWNLIGDFSEAIASIFEAFGGENGQQLTANIIGIFTNAFLEITLLAEKLGRDIITLITKPIVENAGEIKKALDNTLGWMAELAGTAKDAITDLGKSFNTFYDNYIKPIMTQITDLISAAVKKVTEGYNKYVSPVLSKIMTELRELWSNSVKPMVDSVLAALGEVLTFIMNVLAPKIRSMIDTVKPRLAIISGAVEAVWGIVKGILELTVAKVKAVFDVLGGLFRAFNLLLKGDFVGAWRAAAQGVINAGTSIVSGAKGLVNGVINALNVLLRGANAVLGAIPSSIKATVGISNFSIPQIPKLAEGAVIPANSPFLAMLGDQKSGNNLELPENLLRQIVREESGGGKGGAYQFTAQINRRTLFDEFIAEAKLRQAASGRNPLELA